MPSGAPACTRTGFGQLSSDEVRTPVGFAAWLARLAEQSDPARTIELGRHRCTYRWIAESDRVLGGIALRDGDDDYVSWGPATSVTVSGRPPVGEDSAVGRWAGSSTRRVEQAWIGCWQSAPLTTPPQ